MENALSPPFWGQLFRQRRLICRACRAFVDGAFQAIPYSANSSASVPVLVVCWSSPIGGLAAGVFFRGVILAGSFST
jgi:hypothetical protein